MRDPWDITSLSSTGPSAPALEDRDMHGEKGMEQVYDNRVADGTIDKPADGVSLTAAEKRTAAASSVGFKTQFKSELSEKRRLEVGVLVSARYTHCCPS